MEKITFTLNSRITSLEALLSTCYTFIDRFYIYLDKNKSNFLVQLKPKENGKMPGSKIQGEFRNELISNLLREKIAKNNSRIREYIVGQAFSSSVSSPAPSPAAALQIEDDYLNDPLGIAIPWEEKARKKRGRRKSGSGKKRSAKKSR